LAHPPGGGLIWNHLIMYSPNYEAFLEHAKQGNLIPVTRRILADFETPLSAYHKIHGQGEAFLFESVEGGEHLGRYSFVGCNPRAVVRQKGNRVELIEQGKVVEKIPVTRPKKEGEEGADQNKFEVVEQEMKTYGKVEEFTVAYAASEVAMSDHAVRDGLEVVERVMKRYRPVALPGLPRFTGGAVGFIGYEFIHDVEHTVPKPGHDDLKTPVMYFLIADELLIFDRVAQTITILVNAIIEDGMSPQQAYDDAVGEIERIVSLLEQPSMHNPVMIPAEVPSIHFESNVPREKFMANVTKAQEYITAGDIIQVVGSQRFSTPVKASPLDIYRAARSVNPSPYMFLLELEGMALVGASPELHVRCEDRKVEIRPIAGTRPRGKTPEQDAKLEQDLLADPKERAEHVMLVDLARNDLGRVCDFGTVHVRDLMVVERYSHVMHIVSQVEGRLAAEKSTYDLMRATFPAGTLTGAPKIRAMQIISELEQTQRGPYGGCVGYFSFNGNLDCCITIRTALIKDGMAHVQAGGGWVNDSKPEAEFDETVNKAKAMLKAVALAENFTGK
jgi:anthranilate synthase component I